MLREISPGRSGHIVRAGQRIAWEEFGTGDRCVLLLPTWSIVHTDFWRHQVPFLGRGYRVLTFDGLGNGASDRPADPGMYGDLLFADDAAAVLDAAGVERATVVGVSQGGAWALAMAGRHPQRVDAAVFIAAAVALGTPGFPERIAAGEAFDRVLPTHEGWSKWNRHHWLNDFPDFLRFFFSKCFTEPDSEEQIEHFFGMGMETTPQVLLATAGTAATNLDAETARAYAAGLACPALVIAGTGDAIVPFSRSVELARLARARLELMEGAGHEPQCRFPERTNELLAGFLEETAAAG